MWLQINSAAAGNEGDYAPEAAVKWLKEKGSATTAYLRDPSGAVGHLYDARTTPHMFIVNPAGTLVWPKLLLPQATTVPSFFAARLCR